MEEYRQGPIRLFPKKPSYIACITIGRDTIKEGFKRKSLIELSVHTIQKPRDSKEWVRRRRPLRT
jgi:hypothetical protein